MCLAGNLIRLGRPFFLTVLLLFLCGLLAGQTRRAPDDDRLPRRQNPSSGSLVWRIQYDLAGNEHGVEAECCLKTPRPNVET